MASDAASALTPLAVHLGWLWGGELVPRLVLLNACVSSICMCLCLLVLWRVLVARAIPVYEGRSVSDKIFMSNSFVSAWPALTAPMLAWSAIRRLPWDDTGTLMAAAADVHALRAVGLSCGYMLYDTCYCAYYRQMRSPLIIGHHLLPVVFWPYCALNGRAVPIVLFFILTEVTNIGQHARMIILKLGLEDKLAYTIIGVSWVIGFFLVRILPSPYLAYQLLKGSYGEYSNYEVRRLARAFAHDSAHDLAHALPRAISRPHTPRAAFCLPRRSLVASCFSRRCHSSSTRTGSTCSSPA